MKKRLVVTILSLVFGTNLLFSQGTLWYPSSIQDLRDTLVGTFGMVEHINFAWGGPTPYYEYYEYITFSIPSNAISDSLGNQLIMCRYDTTGVIIYTTNITVGMVSGIGYSGFGFIPNRSTLCSSLNNDFILSIGNIGFDASYSNYKKIESNLYNPCDPIDFDYNDTMIHYDTIVLTDTIIYINQTVVNDTIIDTDTTYIIDQFVINDTFIIQETVTVYDTLYTNLSQLEQFEFNIYPNPAKDYFSLKSECNSTLKTNDLKLRILTINGRIVKEYKNEITPCEETHFDVSNIDKGLYFVEISELNGSKKVVKLLLH